MTENEVVFDSDLSIFDVNISSQNKSIILKISEDIDAAYELLERPYKKKIADFVNSSGGWFPVAVNAIKQDVSNIDGLELTTIFVLFEQNSNESVFGLLFELDADVEHGRGLMVSGEDFHIIKYGDASVAFEGVD